MQIYAAAPLVRTRQLTADVTVLAAVVGFAVLGAVVAGGIRTLAEFGRDVEQAGSGFRTTMTDAAAALGGLPLVGGAASAPFASASSAGEALEAAGRDQQNLVSQIALATGLLVALVPIALIVWFWLARRLTFVRQARRASALAASAGGRELLAVRALLSAAPSEVLAIGPDPAGAWRAGDRRVVDALVSLALRDAGVTR